MRLYWLATLAFLLTLASPLHAQTLWATWELVLDGAPPPTSFLLTISNPSGTGAPLALAIPVAPCTTVPGAQYCTMIGCPPTGTHTLTIQAQYAGGLSDLDPSGTFTCTIVNAVCACNTAPVTPPARSVALTAPA